MSASREKRKRQDLYESGAITREPVKQSNAGLPKWANWLIAAAAIVILAIFVWVMVCNSSAFLNTVTAVSVGDTKFSVGETGYYYVDSANSILTNMQNTYGDFMQYFIDPNKSYTSQSYSEDMSWADYFMETAKNNMQWMEILGDEAAANGFDLTEEQKQQMDETYIAMDAEAKESGFIDGVAYLRTIYGKAASEQSFKDYLYRQTLAAEYQTKQLASYSFTKDEIDSYYAENKKDYDTVTYRVLSTPDQLEADRIASVAANHEALFLEEATKLYEAAQAEAETTTETAYDADTATLYEDTTYNAANTLFADWLFDDLRVSGETYVATSESTNGTATYYVVYFLEREVQDQAMVNVRHILITAEDAEDTESVAAAKTKAEELLAEWEAGEATEDSFAALANEHSTDGGSNTNGGLYENVYPGQMVAEFNDWCFDADRQVGDTEIVETSYGFHIMYFSGESTEYDSYLSFMVDNTLRNNAYDAWYTALQEQYPIDEKAFGMLFVNKN